MSNNKNSCLLFYNSHSFPNTCLTIIAFSMYIVWLGPLITVLLIDKVSWCKYYLLLVLILFYSQASTQLQILWVFTGRVLTNRSHRHSSLETTCVHSRYRSRLVTRAGNSQQTIRGTVIRSNRGDKSTATKNKRKTKR